MEKSKNQLQANGKLRMITLKEINQHNTKTSMWTVLNGEVYDLTTYLGSHPGGREKLMMGAGRDCTSLFSN